MPRCQNVPTGDKPVTTEVLPITPGILQEKTWVGQYLWIVEVRFLCEQPRSCGALEVVCSVSHQLLRLWRSTYHNNIKYL